MSITRVIFVNRFFHPDESGTSQILAELASSVALEFPVTVITSRNLSTSPTIKLESREAWHDVEILRVWSTRFGRGLLLGRALDYVSFTASVSWLLLWNVARNDIVVLKTDPPLLQLVNTSIVRLKGGKVINWLQDLYPEIALRLGKFPAPRWFVKLLTAWRDKALNAASVNVVVSDAMARYLRGRGVHNIQVISNWADEVEITPIDHEHNPLRAEWGLEGKFVVMYSGNFGRAHSFSEIAQAVQQLAPETDMRFVFVGEGAGLDALRERLELAQTGNFVFKPFQPKTQLRYSLGAADLHLVSLKAGMEDLLMPSKVYSILAAGRAFAFVGEREGEIAASIRERGTGFAVANGDFGALAEALRQLRKEPARLSICQQNARALFESRYTRCQAVARWLKLFDHPGFKDTVTLPSHTKCDSL